MDAAYDRAKRAGKVFKGNKGGRYADLKVGPNQQRHHMPAQGSGVPKDNGGAVVMEAKDHELTTSWDNSIAAQKFKQRQTELLNQGRYRDAIDMDIQDILKKFPDGRYNNAIQEMIRYYQSIGLY